MTDMIEIPIPPIAPVPSIDPPTPVTQSVPVKKSGLEKLWRIFYVLILSIGFLSVIYYFFLQPMKVAGQDPVDPFIVGQQIFSERLSYLFREPKVGDAVTFKTPTTSDNYNSGNVLNYFGIITKINEQSNVKTYEIISTKTQRTPWIVSRDKIITHIYYPTVKLLDLPKLAFSPAPSADPTSDWTEYTIKDLGVSFKYPAYMAEDKDYYELSDKSASFFGPDSLGFLVKEVEKKLIDPFTWWKVQEVDPVFGEPSKCFDSTMTKISDLDALQITSSNMSDSDCLGPNTGKTIYIVMHSQRLIVIFSPEDILSTFKFIDCTSNKALNMSLELPKDWRCIRNVDRGDVGAMSLESDFFTIEIADGGRGPYCGDGPTPENICRVDSLTLSDEFQLSVFNSNGQDKEIFGGLGQTSRNTNRWVSIKYTDMETKKLTASQKQDLLDLLNSLSFTN